MQIEGDKGLETLQIWQRSLAFAETVCKQVLPLLPAEEKWVLAQQLRRAVQSISANIAEGYGRFYYQEGIRFCYLARGSLEETFSHLTLAHHLGYLDSPTYSPLLSEIKEIRRMLSGYISFLKQSKRGATEPGSALREDFGDYSTDLDLPNS
jgi:four helix bundle protein